MNAPKYASPQRSAEWIAYPSVYTDSTPLAGPAASDDKPRPPAPAPSAPPWTPVPPSPKALPAEELTDALICPITLELMRDPVTPGDSHSYERAAITEWLQKRGTSPLTNEPLRVEDIRPNVALRKVLEALAASEPAPPRPLPAREASSPSAPPLPAELVRHTPAATPVRAPAPRVVAAPVAPVAPAAASISPRVAAPVPSRLPAGAPGCAARQQALRGSDEVYAEFTDTWQDFAATRQAFCRSCDAHLVELAGLKATAEAQVRAAKKSVDRHRAVEQVRLVSTRTAAVAGFARDLRVNITRPVAGESRRPTGTFEESRLAMACVSQRVHAMAKLVRTSEAASMDRAQRVAAASRTRADKDTALARVSKAQQRIGVADEVLKQLAAVSRGK